MFHLSIIDVALSAWSIFIQLMINIPLFLLFLLSWLITRKKVFYTWTMAWVLNIIALVMVLIVSNFFANTNSVDQLFFYALYGSAKILFGVILFVSAIQFSKKNEPFNIPSIFLFSLACLLLLVFLFIPPVIIQFFVYGFVFILLYLGVYVCVKVGNSVECRVAALGFFVHGTMFFHHFIVLISWFTEKKVPVYMSRSSFFDSITEFILALSFFLGVIIRVINELREINLKLEHNQESLRTLVDVDPLTGLKNRRVLRRFFEKIKGKKGCIAFIDVNKFKQINDQWGHGVGDRCLMEIAHKMKEVFRIEDGLFRLGGDEFLIVCPDISKDEMIERLKELKKAIKHSVKGIFLTIAVGVETFDIDSHIDKVLKTADRKMYQDKKTS